ncbi:ATP phosphoribosyltransferase [Candidatus Oleimmundimicrobium sp.]|uniref:ATP phosphoribosyltransferase n=1 Tax=Candidatus Oleimmundimicrobium sp. TaxID=3060597 RepID=UPI0027168DFE|nr:ATP phosphoribosyltransferase [Candidatus Oleimmundimicrobium sp.]MDO8886631.1 ATP phosphoribosyltransferase [Candidatus Oleimmundimicrobium sp.]
MSYLKIALSKGAIYEETLSLFKNAGFDISELRKESRKLRLVNDNEKIEYILTRPFDVPTFVEYGAADLGIVGKDVLMETKKKVFELLDLGYGKCKFVLAALSKEKDDIEENYKHLGQVRVATKFTKVAEDYFTKQGVQAEIIKLHGSVELAPIVGLADEIVDLSSTGKTLADNNLIIVDEIAECSARLIANHVSYKIKSKEINEFLDKVKQVKRSSK